MCDDAAKDDRVIDQAENTLRGSLYREPPSEDRKSHLDELGRVADASVDSQAPRRLACPKVPVNPPQYPPA